MAAQDSTEAKEEPQLADSVSRTGPPILQKRAWYVYPVPTSEELTGVKVTLIVAYLWRTAMDGRTRPSTVYLHAAYTAKHQVLVALAGSLWAPDNHRSLSFQLGFSRFPQPFYGIGPRTPESAGELFTSRTWGLGVIADQEIRPDTRVEAGLHLLKAEVQDRRPGGLLANRTLAGSGGYTVVAPEIGLVLDSRDRLYDPRTGIFIQTRVRASLPPFGATSGFQYLTLDARLYRRALPGAIVALQVAFEGARGAVPFTELPQLGGTSLRAYVYGRWRDRTLVRTQAEWRQHLLWRFGAVAFGAAGVIGKNIGTLDQVPVRTTYGGGLRFNLSTKENANFSMDYARGAQGASELVFRFAEAF